MCALYVVCVCVLVCLLCVLTVLRVLSALSVCLVCVCLVCVRVLSVLIQRASELARLTIHKTFHAHTHTHTHTHTHQLTRYIDLNRQRMVSSAKHLIHKIQPMWVKLRSLLSKKP